jgi:nitrate/TMAO reductase-like tetraheme cytochrome c subunit
MSTQRPTWRERLSPLLALSNNWISRAGVILVTSAAVFWLLLLPTYLGGHAASAYLGILIFLILPVAFFGGLALIPLGIAWRRRRLGPQASLSETLGVGRLTWQNPDLRRLATFVGIVTVANVIIGANLSYRAVEHLDSVQFCGTTCHVVMKPEYTGYQNSPHSKVTCAGCHIGPGASWFVQSKLSGVQQVFAVAFNTYERPIPTPVANLRPARETCEGCHWPDKWGGDRLRVVEHFSDEGTRTRSVLLMRIGGGSATGKGIHSAHVGRGIRVRYGHTDEARQNISWVEYERDGQKREYRAEGADPNAKMQLRQMDCVDCHNRPSHTFEPAERALDRALSNGDVVATLPLIRKAALEIMKKPYATTEIAEREIPAAVKSFFQQQQPAVFSQRAAEVERSAKGVLAAWSKNVFPEMKITWGTYPNNLGHNDFPGCFRCHDDKHKTQDGAKTIGQDCNSCHSMLAMDEEKPKILNDLGVEGQ